MQKALVLTMILLVSACQLNEPSSAPQPSATASVPLSVSSTATQAGMETAAELTRQYHDIRGNCGTDSKPAFLCRGVMLRATLASDAYSSWNPSPNSVKSGGVSFSYLSKDSKFTHVYGYKNGFIFYPVLNRPAGTMQIEVLCAYPMDAGTNNRVAAGCGSHYMDAAGSGPCLTVGIRNSALWVARWNQYKMGYNMCGFDVTDAMNTQAGPSFRYTLNAHNEAGFFAGVHDYVEIILKTWPQDIPKELPIQAFFYVEGGLSAAQHDQRDYFNKTGGTVMPIIKLTLPQTTSADAQFTYSAADQVK